MTTTRVDHQACIKLALLSQNNDQAYQVLVDLDKALDNKEWVLLPYKHGLLDSYFKTRRTLNQRAEIKRLNRRIVLLDLVSNNSALVRREQARHIEQLIAEVNRARQAQPRWWQLWR